MEWQDDGIILGGRRHGETSLILEVMTRRHGRHLGLVKGGRSRRMQPLLQPGTSVVATWRARLDEHLGFYAVEATRLRAADLLGLPAALHALNTMTALLRTLAEREPHEDLFLRAADALASFGGSLEADALALVRLEAALLAESGFGLDLGCCAATGQTHDLIFVSPRTGRAVSGAAGALYADRLFALPRFLREGGDHDGDGEAAMQEGAAAPHMPTREDLHAGFALTGHFLLRDVLGPRGLAMPQARDALIAALRQP